MVINYLALVGWFGPRGLASVVFCLLALEELGSPAADHAAADPLATRYARHLARQAGQRGGAGIPDMPERRLIRRTSHMNHPPGGEQSLAR
jgi:sodium/hydrogen antiporter